MTFYEFIDKLNAPNQANVPHQAVQQLKWPAKIIGAGLQHHMDKQFAKVSSGHNGPEAGFASHIFYPEKEDADGSNSLNPEEKNYATNLQSKNQVDQFVVFGGHYIVVTSIPIITTERKNEYLINKLEQIAQKQGILQYLDMTTISKAFFINNGKTTEGVVKNYAVKIKRK